VSDVLKVNDQSELFNLKNEQATLIDLIEREDSSQGKRILRLGQIMERCIELGAAEYDFPLNQISTQLKKIFEGKPIASFLHRYLPDKYKDPRDQENAKLAEHLTSGRLMVCQNIHTLTNEQLERYFESRVEYDNLLDNNVRVNNKEIQICEQVAQERGLELGGYKYRKPISAHDDHYETPQTLEGLIKATCDTIKRIGCCCNGHKSHFHDIAERYKEYPADNYDDAKKYYLGNQTFEQVLRPEHDLKWSGSWSFWFNRGYLETTEGKHAAGNSDKFPTLYCAWCSRDMKDNPEDYHLMQKHPDSPTGWKCLKCNGTNYITRETTREQVGDRKDEIFTFANTVIETFPFFGDFILRVHESYWKPIIDGRKSRIGYQFSNSAIAGTDTKVLRKVTK